MAANNKLFIYDCLLRKLRAAEAAIMTIGADGKSTFVLDMEAEEGGSFAQRNDNCHFFPHGSVASYTLNGTRQQGDVLIAPFKFYLFVLGRGCFVCWFGPREKMPDFASFNPSAWYLYDQEHSQWTGPMELEDVPPMAAALPDNALATFEGLGHRAFFLRDILPVAQRVRIRRRAAKEPRPQEEQPSPAPPASQEEREVSCPCCWKTFRPSQIMNIAVHASLQGDSLLGEHAMRRFLPAAFNEKGQALDERGMICTDFACPHCHHKLPPFFLQLPHRIFSIVGAPSSGKTYYLTTLIRSLEKYLPQEFRISFRDSDPVANAPLNAMKMRLFSAGSPEEAFLPKTEPDGETYESLPLNGHLVRLPKPFIYKIQKESHVFSIVMYDNAGEDFEPNLRNEESLGSRHVAMASAIFFLFDPTSSPAFRRLLEGHPDPQFRARASAIDQQSAILTEIEVRIKTALCLQPQEKIDIPLAVILGKSDVWQHLLDPAPLLPIVREGLLLLRNIQANSQRIRQFMFGIHPDICSNAEAISNNVSYFAASSLGISPVECIRKSTGQCIIAPDPSKLNPQHACAPVLWALSLLNPALFPTPAA